MTRMYAFLLCVALFARPWDTVGAHPVESPYHTYHADMIFVTPYMTKIEGQVGFHAADAGSEYLVVWMQAVNRNDVPLFISSNEFSLIKDDGTFTSSEMFTPAPGFGALIAPSGVLKGTMTFTVAQGSHRATLHWAPVPISGAAHWPEFSWTIHY